MGPPTRALNYNCIGILTKSYVIFEYRPKIVVFTKGPCLGPPSWGRVYASTPILNEPVEGH